MSDPSLVVLAAGQGTRLRPLTDRLPKAMVPVLDVPLVDLALAHAAGIGWHRVLVNVSGPAPGLREHLAARPTVEVFDEGPEPLGQAATLRALLPLLGDTVVTFNCDLVTDLDLARLLERHAAEDSGCTLAVLPVDRGADLAADGVESRPGGADAAKDAGLAAGRGGLRLVDRRFEDGPGYRFLGAACFERRLLERIPEIRPLGLVAGLMRRSVEEGDVTLLEHRGYGHDAGSLERYLAISLAATSGLRLAPAPPGELAGGCYFGPGARVEGNAGPAAVVLAGAAVLRGCSISNCVVWPGSAVAPGRYDGGIWFGDRWLPA